MPLEQILITSWAQGHRLYLQGRLRQLYGEGGLTFGACLKRWVRENRRAHRSLRLLPLAREASRRRSPGFADAAHWGIKNCRVGPLCGSISMSRGQWKCRSSGDRCEDCMKPYAEVGREAWQSFEWPVRSTGSVWASCCLAMGSRRIAPSLRRSWRDEPKTARVALEKEEIMWLGLEPKVLHLLDRQDPTPVPASMSGVDSAGSMAYRASA